MGKRVIGIKKPEKLIPAKQAKVLEAMAQGIPAEIAVVEAGYNLTENNAKAMGWALWKKHTTGNNTLIASLENVGVTPERVAGKLSGLLDAKQQIVTKTGLMEVNDNSAQLKALDMTLKVVGGYAPTKSEVTSIKFENILLQIEGMDGDE